jgi:protein gp37
MAQSSAIEWTDATWNPVTGCAKVSQGCKHCYAKRLALRLQAMGNPRYRNGFAVTLQSDLMEIPLRWKSPRKIFVNSMSDLFHPRVPDAYIRRVFEVMAQADWHIFQVLTKRPERMRELSPSLDWRPHIWMGVSVESDRYKARIHDLRKSGAAVKFLSVEPLLGPISRLPLTGISWVIVGGESGPRAREMKPEWARTIRDRCVTRGVPFFFKQWGGKRKKAAGRLLDGQTWDQMPQA